MKRNQILVIAKGLIKGVIAIMMLIVLVLIVLTIHWHFDTSYYDYVYLENGFKAGLYTLNLQISNEELTNVSLGSLSPANMYWLIGRSILLILLKLYALVTVLKMINVIEDLESFYKQSIKAFNQLSVVYLIISSIAFFNVEWIEGGANWHFTIPFQPLLAASFCLVLREVFKEVLKLHQDSKSII